MADDLYVYIGIDGGKDGAVAVKVQGSSIVDFYDTPTYEVKKASGKGSKREFDEACMRDIVKPFKVKNVLVILEKAQSMPGQGVASMFSTGEGYGLWRGILTGLEIPYEIVIAQRWQKLMGFTQGDPKGQSYRIASRLFPEAMMRGPKGGIKDGRCDAALIAYYGECMRGGTNA